MKIGVISNTDHCIQLLNYLVSHKIETVFYLGKYSSENISIGSLISFCAANYIPVEEEQQKEQLYTWLKKERPDHTFIFGYGTLIDTSELEDPEHIYNIHPGKLPQYRGANPVFWQLKNGEGELGLSIHLLTGKFDQGAIIWQKEIKNQPHFSFGLVEFLFGNILVEGVNFIIGTNRTEIIKNALPQDESKSVSYKRPVLADVLINWNKMSAAKIVDLVRACNPWNKGAIAVYNNMEIKILDAELYDTKGAAVQPGQIIEMTDVSILVACYQNSTIKINHMNINGIFVPARFADKFGFTKGQSFSSMPR